MCKFDKLIKIWFINSIWIFLKDKYVRAQILVHVKAKLLTWCELKLMPTMNVYYNVEHTYKSWYFFDVAITKRLRMNAGRNVK